MAYWVENACLLAKVRVMLNGYQFRLYPNAEQQQILLRWFGCQRLIYNAKVQEDRYYRRFQRRMIGPVGKASPVDHKYSRFISKRTDFLRKVLSQILRNGAVTFRQAYQRFFKKLGGRRNSRRSPGSRRSGSLRSYSSSVHKSMIRQAKSDPISSP